MAAPNHAPVPPNDRADYERAVALTRETLGQAAFEAEWAAGQALGLERAVADILEPSLIPYSALHPSRLPR